MTDKWFVSQLERSKELLSDQDKSPQFIQAYLSSMPAFKLGHYFENLVSYWFEIDPNYEILQKNLVISSETRTIGEFDLILREISSNKTIHLEVAVKFFLKIIINSKEQWVGPNLKDTLELKYNKLVDKQITLSSHVDSITKFKKLDIHIDDHWIFLKGRLFSDENNDGYENKWFNIVDFNMTKTPDSSQWVILDKTHWLSEINNLEYNFLPNEIYSKQQLIEKLNEILEKTPICVAQAINDIEVNRFFITPNDWHERAVKQLS